MMSCRSGTQGLRLPAACDLYENAVSLGVTSKSLGLAGLRIGWIATRNRAVLDAMVAFKDYTTICANSPGEFLAALALRNRDILLQRNMDIIRSNLILLDGFFARFASFLQWHKPVAGPIAFPRLRDDLDANALCIDVLERNGVLLLPGSVYQFGSHHVRIGFGRRNMPQALAALEDYFTERFAP